MENAHFKPVLNRYRVAVFKTVDEAVDFAASNFREIAASSIAKHHNFSTALSGGSTPKMIFEKIAKIDLRDPLHWSKIQVFFGDERAVARDSSESNYHNAYEALLSKVPLMEANIHRMKAEKEIEKNAHEYEKLLRKYAPDGLDFVMLGIGEDGHTASLFPSTAALEEKEHLVAANWVESKKCWRMTLTYPALKMAKRLCVYAFGESKSKILTEIFTNPARESPYPIERVGTPQKPLYWIVDEKAIQGAKDSGLSF